MRKFLGQNKGFSLVEIMMACGVLGVMVTALSSYLVNTTNELSVAERQATLNTIYENLRITAAAPSSIAYSVNQGQSGK